MKVLVLATLLFTIAVTNSVVFAQSDSLTYVPVTIKPPPPPVDICGLAETGARMNSGDILARLEKGELSAAAPADTATSLTYRPSFRCEDGPRRIIHTVPNEFHWPPIYRGSCDNLFCRDPPCFVRKKVWVTKCVLVFKLIYGRWVFIGPRLRRYLDHKECGCKECSDIRDRTWCIKTKPCPNSYNPASFCYWTPFFVALDLTSAVKTTPSTSVDAVVAPIPLPIHGRCRCCSPIYCPPPKIFVKARCRCECPLIRCPPGQIFNSKTCKCDCPKGSKKNSDGICIGDCEDINLKYCRFVKCTDNPVLQCKVEDYKCVCSSCDDVGSSPLRCKNSKCLEQKTKPRCIFDTYSNKCRCPRCEDRNDKPWCDQTYCGPNNHLQCRWNPYYNTCSCPHYG